MTLATIWYALVAVLIGGYAVLDGFDLGVGTLYPFIAKTEDEKGALRTAIGPVWDGNEVWLLTGGGALFAAFPPVYATVFSGFYLAMMLVLFSLIFRAVSLENRTSGSWTPLWDLGVLPRQRAARAVVRRCHGQHRARCAPRRERRVRRHLLHPAQSLRIVDRCPGPEHVRHPRRGLGGPQDAREHCHSRAVAVRSAAHWAFVALVVVATLVTALLVSDQPGRVVRNPLGWVMLVLLVGGIVYTRLSIARGGDGGAFLGSAVGILGLVGLVAVGNYPNLVPALDDPARSLTVSNSASSDLTLTVMLIIAVVGVPIVLAYTALVYRSFWGRVSAGDSAGH